MQQSTCLQSAARGFHFSWRWQTGSASFNRRKTQLGIGALQEPCIVNSITLYICQLSYCRQHLQFSLQYVIWKWKLIMTPQGGPVKLFTFYTLLQNVKNKLMSKGASARYLKCARETTFWFFCEAAADTAVRRYSTIYCTLCSSLSSLRYNYCYALARKLSRKRFKRSLWIKCMHSCD